MREENIVLHHICGIASESILNNGNFVVKHNISGKGGLVDKGNAIRDDVEEGGLTSSGRAHNVGSKARSSITRAVLNDHTPLELKAQLLSFLLVTLYFDLELNVFPAELNRHCTFELCFFDKLGSIDCITSGK